MVLISWCLAQKNGIQLAEPNKNMSQSYIKMAEESIAILSGVEKSRIWTATTSYYIFYYSLYSLMLRIGVKCEIHSCSLEFMKQFLHEFYNKKDIDMMNTAFSARIDLQYYSDRPVDESAIKEIKAYCKDFYIKTKKSLSIINEDQVNAIRDRLKEKT
ncbi:MAG: hypothetical protein NT001_05390 [Candidatus Woesearchaeota archaeon]|nr:hypothetical protein [Candidatus Woesearchaeota archaeon]